jgi:hypothetical protein
VPEAVRNLIEYSALKTAAEQIGVEAIDRRHNILKIKFHKEARVDPARLMGIVAKTRGAQFTPAGVLLVPLAGQTAAGDILKFLGEKMRQLRARGGWGRGELHYCLLAEIREWFVPGLVAQKGTSRARGTTSASRAFPAHLDYFRMP